MNKALTITDDTVVNKIYLMRGTKVMMDRDLAEMYGVQTRRLNEQVKRNERRFPPDFMFQLTEKELEDWKSQNATSNKDILLKLEKIEQNILKQDSKLNRHEKEMQIVFKALRKLLNPQAEPMRKIGFNQSSC